MKIMIFFVMILSVSFAQADFKRGACKEDLEKFCKDIKGGQGRIMKCLKENEAQLSEGCRTNALAMKGKMKELHEACEADIKTHCGDTMKGRGRILVCLKKAPNVSEGCKAALEKKQE